LKSKSLSIFLIVLLLFVMLPISPAQSLEIMAEEQAVKRISGANRYGTAVAISQEGWETADTVVLARGDDYADALAGVPLAYALDAPMLLTHKDRLTESTKDEILRLKAKKVYILGGTGAVSEVVEDAVKAMGLDVVRVSGSNRFGTAAAVAKELTKIRPATKVVLAYGLDFPDALAAASYAAINGFPILLVRTNSLTSATEAVIAELNIEDFIVVGGTGVISEALFNSLSSATRIAGKNRFGTAVELAKYFTPGTERVYLATGMNFADAITGGVLAAKNGNGMLLIQQDRIPQSVKDYIDNNNYSQVAAFGGSGAISDGVLNSLSNMQQEIGNSNGNLANGGRVTYSDGWVYYSYAEGIFRKNDAGIEKKISSVDASHLNVVGDWVYYIDHSEYFDRGYIYRMHLDGSNPELLSSDFAMYMNVLGEWIYYYSSHIIYRMRFDGSAKELICNSGGWGDTYATGINVANGYIYYISVIDQDSWEQTIFTKVNIETGETTFGESTYGGGVGYDLIVEENWAYYGTNCIEKGSLEGEFPKPLNNDDYSVFNVADGFIYYLPWDGSALYKMRTDGSNLTCLYQFGSLDEDCYVNGIFIAGERIYITFYTPAYHWKVPGTYEMYRMNLDGSDCEQVYTCTPDPKVELFEIQGTVTSEVFPLDDIYIEANNDGDWDSACLDSDGHYSLLLAAGSYTLGIWDWDDDGDEILLYQTEIVVTQDAVLAPIELD